jgi:hypothetical protein
VQTQRDPSAYDMLDLAHWEFLDEQRRRHPRQRAQEGTHRLGARQRGRPLPLLEGGNGDPRRSTEVEKRPRGSASLTAAE